jgi:hypothetical protein
MTATNRHAPGQKLPTACTSVSKGKLSPNRHNVSSKGKGKAKSCNWFHNACQGIDKSYAGRMFTCISCDDSD